MIAPTAPAVHLRALTPLQFLERSANVYREKIAVIDDDLRMTYPELRAYVHRLAHVLRALRALPGDRVAVLAPNTHVLLAAHFASPLAQTVLCALNIRLNAAEIAYILDHCGASVVLYDQEFAGLVAAVRERRAAGSAAASTYVAIGTDPAADAELATLLAQAPAEDFAGADTDEDATLSINYTSGTTGQPKGVMYTYRGAFLNAQAEIFHAGLRPESVYLWTLPMFHCNGWIFPWAVTAAGATHVCLRRVDPARVLALIETEGVTHLCAAPTVLISIANHPGVTPFPRPVHVTTAGAPPSPTIITQMEALGATITHVYGLTETYGPITVCAWKSPLWDSLEPGERARLKSRQGVPMLTLGFDDVRVVDPELRDVPRDGATQGEVVMRGNNVMKGYYNDLDATAKAFAGGWFHSGDLGVWHADGYIELIDRAKDVIISGGENISTIQVEKALLAHDAVMEVAVVAIPDEKWGEVPKAFVTLKPGRSLEADELIAFARTLLPGFKVPKTIEFGELPKTSTGKIQKFVLREREWKDRDKRVH